MINSFKSRVIQFWKAFEEEESTIREMMDNNVDGNILINFTQSILNTTFNNIQFQIGINIDDKYELTLTPQGDRVKLIQYIYWLKYVPTNLSKNWVFYASKPASKDTDYKVDMFGITLMEEDLVLYPQISYENSKIGLEVFCPKLENLPDSQKYSIFFVFLDQHISELYTIEHISNIQFTNEKLNKEQISTTSLKQYIDDTIDKNGWTKSTNPLDGYIGYKVKQTTKTDWILREDIAAGYSSCTAPISAYHFKDNSFFKKYEKDGLIFGFLFFENIDIKDDQVVSFRASIEDKIIEKTNIHNIADCIGGATGFHFSYIDFIIYDFEAFMKIAKKIMSNYGFEETGFSYFISGSKPIMLSDTSV